MFSLLRHSADIARRGGYKSLQLLSPCRAGARPGCGVGGGGVFGSETRPLVLPPPPPSLPSNPPVCAKSIEKSLNKKKQKRAGMPNLASAYLRERVRGVGGQKKRKGVWHAVA